MRTDPDILVESGADSRVRRVWLIAIAAACVLAPPPGAAAQGVQTLRVLTYNVHGLPHLIAGDEPAMRMPEISQRLGAYHVAFVQEDFEYPRLLASRLPPATQTYRGPGRRLHWKQVAYIPLVPLVVVCWGVPHCSLPQGSGLTTFVRAGIPSRVVRERHYRSCSGFYGRATDCMGSKGYQALELEVTGGRKLHVYNTHVDAGTHASDVRQRRAQFTQLAAAIQSQSAGRAVIVAGDLNSRLFNWGDQQALGALLRGVAPALTDSGGHEKLPDPDWEGLDYLLFRSSAELEVRMRNARQAGGFELGGRPLSDHPAIEATFELVPR